MTASEQMKHELKYSQLLSNNLVLKRKVADLQKHNQELIDLGIGLQKENNELMSRVYTLEHREKHPMCTCGKCIGLPDLEDFYKDEKEAAE